MKVLHLITRINSGGTARWLETLCSGLRENGHVVHLAAGFVETNEIEDPLFETMKSIRIKHLSREITFFLIGDIKAFFEVRRLITSIQPDILNTHTAKAGLIARTAALTLKINRPIIIHTFHGHLLYGYFAPWKTKLIVCLERFLARRSRALIVSGEVVKRDLLDNQIGKPSDYYVVNPGVQTLAKLSKSVTKEYFGLRHGKISVGWLGRMTDVKNPNIVIELARRLPEIDFLMCGDGELLERLRETSPHNVYLPGWSTPQLTWSASDIAILTSRNEAQPIALIEAASSGLPTVAFNVGGVSGVVENGSTGYLVSDVSEMEIMLSKLASSANLRQSLGIEAEKKASLEFSVSQFMNKHIDIYREVLDEKK